MINVSEGKLYFFIVIRPAKMGVSQFPVNLGEGL
jgi:hypothetical protein